MLTEQQAQIGKVLSAAAYDDIAIRIKGSEYLKSEQAIYSL